MEAPFTPDENSLSINLDMKEHFRDLKGGEMDQIGKVVKAAVEAAIPAIIKAVKEVILETVRREVNPLLLQSQFANDQLDQNIRKENLRFAGIPEVAGQSEAELVGEVIKIAKEAGVELSQNDVDTCHRLGAPKQLAPSPSQPTPEDGQQRTPKPRPRQVID